MNVMNSALEHVKNIGRYAVENSKNHAERNFAMVFGALSLSLILTGFTVIGLISRSAALVLIIVLIMPFGYIGTLVYHRYARSWLLSQGLNEESWFLGLGLGLLMMLSFFGILFLIMVIFIGVSRLM